MSWSLGRVIISILTNLKMENFSFGGYFNCCYDPRDLVAELPFILMHPKPQEDSPQPNRPLATAVTSRTNEPNVPVDTNLIQLDT